jgi:signal transduction histidine kinase
VTDQGIGISEEDQLHLFSSFFRGANATNIQGTGMGLHIVKRYVELLGGQIQIQSQLSKGTTVTFAIPVNLPS